MSYYTPRKSLKVLVACEFTGTVRNAFNALGHDAWSCDLLPAEDRSNRHIRGDVRDHLHEGWDLLMVAHPPCTRLCNSGVRWLTEPPGKLDANTYPPQEVAAYAAMTRAQRLAYMWNGLAQGADLFSTLWNAPIERVAIENPVMHGHAKERIKNYSEFAQSVQPWQFGHKEFKRTCLWLRGLPALTYTNVLTPPTDPKERKKWARVHNAAPGPDRWKERSRFFSGIAAAMAEQWGGYALEDERAAA
jgi:hypothetical protein